MERADAWASLNLPIETSSANAGYEVLATNDNAMDALIRHVLGAPDEGPCR